MRVAKVAAEFIGEDDREVFFVMCLSTKNQVVAVDSTPSREEIEVTMRLVEAGKIIGIEVLDHIIVSYKGNYYSMKKHGKM